MALVEVEGEGEDAVVRYYPGVLVRHIKKSKDEGITHVLHFDDGGWERVGLPDPSIHILPEPRVTRCVCARCRVYGDEGRALPLHFIG